ncbi:MAG: hypothetical protein AAF566_12175, partial [Pseudomonadota bacterium]
VVAALLTLGTWLADHGYPGRGLRHRGWLILAALVNGALWIITATPYPIEAAGLLGLAALTGWALRRAPAGAAPLLMGRPWPTRYVLPSVLCLVAVPVYSWLLREGAPIPPDGIVWPVALVGAAWFAAALFRAFIGRRA